MTRPTRSSMAAIVPALLLVGLPEVAEAGSDPGVANAVFKVGAALLVSGIFVYNHFKGRIRGFLGGLVSRGRRG